MLTRSGRSDIPHPSRLIRLLSGPRRHVGAAVGGRAGWLAGPEGLPLGTSGHRCRHPDPAGCGLPASTGCRSTPAPGTRHKATFARRCVEPAAAGVLARLVPSSAGTPHAASGGRGGQRRGRIGGAGAGAARGVGCGACGVSRPSLLQMEVACTPGRHPSCARWKPVRHMLRRAFGDIRDITLISRQDAESPGGSRSPGSVVRGWTTGLHRGAGLCLWGRCVNCRGDAIRRFGVPCAGAQGVAEPIGAEARREPGVHPLDFAWPAGRHWPGSGPSSITSMRMSSSHAVAVP